MSPTGYPPTGYPPPIPSVNRDRPPASLPPGEIAPPIGRRPPQPLPGKAEEPPPVPPLRRPRQASEPMLLPGQIIELEEKRKQEALLPGQKIAMEEERRRRREETLRKRQSEPALHSPPPLPGPASGGGARGADPYVDMAPVPLDRMMEKTLSFHERQPSTERVCILHAFVVFYARVFELSLCHSESFHLLPFSNQVNRMTTNATISLRGRMPSEFSFVQERLWGGAIVIH